jgi:hypothetical protein
MLPISISCPFPIHKHQRREHVYVDYSINQGRQKHPSSEYFSRPAMHWIWPIRLTHRILNLQSSSYLLKLFSLSPFSFYQQHGCQADRSVQLNICPRLPFSFLHPRIKLNSLFFLVPNFPPRSSFFLFTYPCLYPSLSASLPTCTISTTDLDHSLPSLSSIARSVQPTFGSSLMRTS